MYRPLTASKYLHFPAVPGFVLGPCFVSPAARHRRRAFRQGSNLGGVVLSEERLSGSCLFLLKLFAAHHKGGDREISRSLNWKLAVCCTLCIFFRALLSLGPLLSLSFSLCFCASRHNCSDRVLKRLALACFARKLGCFSEDVGLQRYARERR